jgi:hypothetical protein
MNTFERLGLYGSAPCWSRKGKSRKTLRREFNMRLHSKGRDRRRDSGASTNWGKGQLDSEDVGQNRQRVVVLRKAQLTDPVLAGTRADDSCNNKPA